MKKILFALALAVVATACQRDAVENEMAFGKIHLNAATRSDVSEATTTERFVLSPVLVPEAKNLKVVISGNGENRSWESLEKFNEALAEGLTFASAPYTATLSCGEKGAEGWSMPYFEGSTSFEVPDYGLSADVSVDVALANSIIAIETTDNFKGYFPESSFKINNIEWDATRGELLFVNPGEVTISCEAVRQTGSVTNLQNKVTLKPTTRHKVVFDLSTAGNARVNISFDNEIIETIELEFELNENA